VAQCGAIDLNASDSVTIDVLLRAIVALLNGCPVASAGTRRGDTTIR